MPPKFSRQLRNSLSAGFTESVCTEPIDPRSIPRRDNLVSLN